MTEELLAVTAEQEDEARQVGTEVLSAVGRMADEVCK